MNKENKKLIQWIWPICFLAVSCLPSKVVVSLKKNSIVTPLSVDISNVQVVNHQIIITGTNLNTVSNLKIKEGASQTSLQIESKSNTSIVANTLSNVSFAAGRIFDFILSNANGASTFTVDFSLCDSKLGGKGFNCLIAPTDKQVLSYDIGTGKWRPRSVNGLNYQGTWSGLPALPAAGVLIPGDYYIVSVANGAYNVGDWIVLNQDGVTFEQVENSAGVISVFGRNGNVVAAENDYVLDKMGDVDLSTPPTSGDTLVFDGSHWVAGTAGGGGAPSGGAGGDLAGTYPNPTIGTNKITDAHIANAAISQTKINGLATSLSGKEPAITGAATTTYFRGDKTFVTLDTSAVPEGSRLYFTNARALGILLAGFDNTLTGQVSAADSMLQGFGRLQNQINSLNSGGSNYLVKNGADTISGTVSLTNVLTASGAGDIVVPSIPLTMTSAINKTYADGKLDKTTGGVVAGVVTLDNDLKIKSGSNYVTIRGNAATAADYNFVLPVNAGTAGYLLSTDGNGNTSWVTAGGGGAPTGAATGDLGGNYPAPTVATVGGVTAANVATGANLANAATNLNTASVIVKRDASGNFSAGTITATLNGTATNLSGTVAVANGGTGATTLGLNQLLFGNGTGVIGTLATTVTPSVLLSAVTTGAPTWTTSTAGNVLKGSVTGVEFGTLALSDLPAGTLSGAGTVNYVPYYNATNTLADSPIVVSGTSVGIGTASPASNLHISAASPFLTISDTNTGVNSEAGLFLEADGSSGGVSVLPAAFNNPVAWADSLLIYSDNINSGGLRLHANAGKISFSTGSSPQVDRMIVESSGNVGIGTDTPNVSGLAATSKVLTIAGDGTTSTASGVLELVNPRPNVSIAAFDKVGSLSFLLPNNSGTGGSSMGEIVTQVDGSGGAGGYGSKMFFKTRLDNSGVAATSKMVIDNAGNVGIGTTSPGSKLDVKGTLRLSGSSSGYVGFAPAAAAGSTTYTLPSADGSAGQILKTNGAGVLSWVTDSTGGSVFSGTASRAVATDGAGALTSAATTSTELGYVSGVTSSIQTQLNAKEPTITGGSATQYLKGDKSLGTFLTDVMNSLLTGISFATNSAIVAGDNLLVALGKLQAQVSGLATSTANYLVKNGTDSISGTVNVTGTMNVTTGFLTITNPPSVLTDAVNKQYVDTFGRWTISGSDIYRASGNVGIGTTPTSTLNVNGAIVSNSVSNTVAYINFETGNVQVSTTAATTINVCGMKDGGSYTLVLTGVAASTLVTVNAYSTYVSTSSCTGALQVDLGTNEVTQFTTGSSGTTNILSFVYVASRAVYGVPAVNYTK